MDIDKIEFKYPRYIMDNMQLLIGDNDPFTVTNQMISSIYLEKDFDNALFAYFEITCMVPYWVYANIATDVDKTYATVDFKYVMMDREISAFPSLTTEIKGKYKCFFEMASPSVVGEKLLEVETKDGTRNEGYSFNDLYPVTMALYNESYLKAMKVKSNYILSSTTLLNALTLVLNKAGISNVLLSPPDNNKTYREFRILPFNTKKQLYYLCNNYGFHKNGTYIFFDLDKCYIISKKAECDAYVSNEWTTTHIVSLDRFRQHGISLGGHYLESKEKCNVIRMLDDSFIPKDQAADISEGFTLIDTTTGSVSTIGEKGGAYVFNSGADSSGIMKTMLDEKKAGFTCTLQHCILSALAPNKKFVLEIDAKDYSDFCGIYRILRYSANFQRDGNYWVPSVVAEFRSSDFK